MAAARESRLVAIVGATASGKSRLAMQVAERWKGEIIAADSRTVYRGMDVGTAKPGHADQARVPHHLIDVANPDEAFTAADFQSQARAAVAGIQGRGKLPIVVGGTGLYVDALLYSFEFRAAADPALRKELEGLSIHELQQRVNRQGLPMPRNERNPRHLMRIIETNGQAATRFPLPQGTFMVGIIVHQQQLTELIAKRVDAMFAQGLEAEVKNLADRYGWSAEALKAIGYHEFRAYFTGGQSIDETKRQIIRNTVMYAKRQRTWFRRNPDVTWCDGIEQAFETISTYLSKN